MRPQCGSSIGRKSPRAEVAQEGQASLARVEVAQKSRDEEMTEACVTNNVENVKPLRGVLPSRM